MRRIICGILFLLPFSLSALDVFLAPILYLDDPAGTRLGSAIVQQDLLQTLQQAEAGLELNFLRTVDNRINPPESQVEAVTVCRNERADYLLYGYVTKRERSIQAEIRLFDYQSRSTRQTFFAMDDAKHYDRAIADLSHKILTYIADTFNLRVVVDAPAYTHLSVPAALGYWTAMSPEWTGLLTGTVTAMTGFTVIPTDRLFTLWGKSFYLSTGLEMMYRLGVSNPDTHTAFYHGMLFSFPAKLHMVLAQRHQAYIGVACDYFLDIFNIASKYEEAENKVYNNTGFNLRLGYEFFLSPNVVMFFNNSFEFNFLEKPLCTYSPSIGVDIRLYSKEIQPKW